MNGPEWKLSELLKSTKSKMSSVYKPKNGDEAMELFVQPVKLSTLELKALRKHIKDHPNDLESRLKLMGNIQVPRAAKVWEELICHYIWFIENFPEHPTHLYLMFPWMEESPHYQKVSKCWKKMMRLHSENGALLGNAGSFFRLIEPALALKAFKKAASLEPKNVRILERYYSTALIMIAFKKISAKETLKIGISLFDCLKEKSHRVSLASNLMGVAAWAKDEVRCKKFAKFVLANYPEGAYFYTWAIHSSHIYLAWCAFRKGDLKGFELHLQQAERIPIEIGYDPYCIIYRDLNKLSTRDRILDYLKFCLDSNSGWLIKTKMREIRSDSKVDLNSYLYHELTMTDFYNWSLEY